MFSDKLLRQLRNDIQIHHLMQVYLKIPLSFRDGFYRFRCPNCLEMNTGINPQTNLARCFLCMQNLNPIDIVMVQRKRSFREAVGFLVKTLKI